MKAWPFVGVGLVMAGLGATAFQPTTGQIARYSTPLEGRTESQRHNAVRALEELQGAIIKSGETFSFNQHVRGWTRDLGYKKAPVSYNGQLVLSWGGGVCQLSTTLYNAALEGGLEVVERHRHQFAPQYVPPGRDAAVAYENIDLKLRNPHPFAVQIRGMIQGDMLVVWLEGSGKPKLPDAVREEVIDWRSPQEFTIRKGGRRVVRNTGKAGFEVRVWRHWGDRRELVSQDNYDALNRIVEFR